MRIKDILIWLLIFIVGALIVSAISNSSFISAIKSQFKTISNSGEGYINLNIEDFNKNPNNYLGKNVTTSAVYYGWCMSGISCGEIACYTFHDSQGYRLDVALDAERVFTVGNTYSLKGMIKSCDIPNLRTDYYLKE